jgi:S-adenosylmethionine:diacylglycerol 3-amino-3-carboxypropyl transferase
MDKMDTGRFDLNDIQHEPTDEQLESLMNSVSQEAQRRAAVARQNLMQRLREEIATASRQGAAA